MSIFDRIRRIAKANLNRLLDQAEPAEQELEAKIKELQEAIYEGRESAASYGATFRRMENEMKDLQLQQTDLAKQAETAVKTNDEQTARRALMEKVHIGERITQMKPGLDNGRRNFEKLRDNIIKLQDQLKAAKLKLQDLKARKRAAEAQKAFEGHLNKGSSLSADGVSFDRLTEEVEQSEAEVEIAAEMRGDTLRDWDLAEKARDLQVEAELEALKEKLEDN